MLTVGILDACSCSGEQKEAVAGHQAHHAQTLQVKGRNPCFCSLRPPHCNILLQQEAPVLQRERGRGETLSMSLAHLDRLSYAGSIYTTCLDAWNSGMSVLAFDLWMLPAHPSLGLTTSCQH